jgi:pilus assembly protein Flp/PilA
LERWLKWRVGSFPRQGYHDMTLHPQILTNAPIANRSGIFRLKALFSEQRARESSEPRSSSDWEELAIEWHTMANLVDSAKGKNSQSDMLESRNVRRSNAGFGDAVLGCSDECMQKMRSNYPFSCGVHRRSMNAVRRFVADENAATAIEYCLIATGIALGIFVAVAGIEARINSEFTAINNSLK